MLEDLILIKGAGDLASAVAHKLFRSGLKVVMTEIEKPTCLRKYVSFATAIYEGQWQVEGVESQKIHQYWEVKQGLRQNYIPILIDEGEGLKKLINPAVYIDATLSKKNLGTTINDAPLVIGLGPGFKAGIDVDMVIETNRGHHLGKIILEGEAEGDTGIPGVIGGYSWERVLRSPKDGKVQNLKNIGDLVEVGEVISKVEGEEIKAPIAGIIRGLIHNGIQVFRGQKIGDIDPRGNKEFVYRISDKGRCVAGGVLEAIMMWKSRGGRNDEISK